MQKTVENITTQNYIPLTSKEQQGEEYGFGKLATGIGQIGFTLGTIGAVSTQLGLELAATALLAPETGGGSLVAEGASIANKFKRLLNIGEFFEKLKQKNSSL